MIRALTLVAAVVALAVSASPVWAGTANTAGMPEPTHQNAGAVGVMLLHGDFATVIYNGHAGLGANASTRILSMDHNI